MHFGFDESDREDSEGSEIEEAPEDGDQIDIDIGEVNEDLEPAPENRQ